VKIVADADEGETLVEKFADAGGSEKEEAKYDIVLARRGNELLRGGAELGRSVHVRELVLFIQAHGHAEIVLAEEEDVHAGTAAISSIFLVQSAVSTWRATMTLLLAPPA